MPLTLEAELAQIMREAAAAAAAPATCRRCGIGWPEHGQAGGPVRYTVGGWSSPASAIPVTCPGFAWVDPGGPAVRSYLEPPAIS